MTLGIAEDNALKQALKGIIVTDEKNASREVGVWFANPDVETRTQSYPYMTIEMIDFRRAGYRQSSGIMTDTDAQGTIPEQNNVSYTYGIPVPWDLVYQITAYSRHPRHDRAISMYLLNNIFPGQHGYLAIKDDLGVNTGYRHMILEEFAKRDTVENGRRLHRSVFTVSITSEGYAQFPTAGTAATSVKINTTTSDIPPGLQAI